MKTVISHQVQMWTHEIPSWIDTSDEMEYTKFIMKVNMENYQVKKDSRDYDPLVAVEDNYDEIFLEIDIEDILQWKYDSCEDDGILASEKIQEIIYGTQPNFKSIEDLFFKEDVTLDKFIKFIDLGYFPLYKVRNSKQLATYLGVTDYDIESMEVEHGDESEAGQFLVKPIFNKHKKEN